jgi:DNA-binding NarL/FixJ family response regulator
VREALRAGASGYLVKAVPSGMLVSAVRATACGRSVLDDAARAALSQPPERDDVADRLARLTPRQRAVLRLIGEGLTNRAIGDRLGLAEKTVKNNTSELLATLALDNRTQAAILATRVRDDAAPDG